MTDLIVQAGTKFALEQWMDARGLGQNVQDTDPSSPTFGDYFYTNDLTRSHFYYWRQPSGKLESSFDPGTGTATYFNGFYASLTFRDGFVPEDLRSWVESSTATSILEVFNGVGGEGITIIAPEDVVAHLDSIGAPRHSLQEGMRWSDPSLWAFSNVMIDDERDFDGVTWKSLIDFNVWTPTQYPSGWEEVGPSGPSIEPWVQPVGSVDAYELGAIVTHNGQTWENTGSNANVWEPGVFGWEVI